MSTEKTIIAPLTDPSSTPTKMEGLDGDKKRKREEEDEKRKKEEEDVKRKEKDEEEGESFSKRVPCYILLTFVGFHSTHTCARGRRRGGGQS